MTLMQENFRDWETPATALTLCVGTAIATLSSVCVAWNHPLRAYASVAGLGLGIWGQVLVQADMRKNRRQKMVQVANDTIFDAGIEVYTTTAIQEMQPTRGVYYQPDIPYVDESDIEALPEPTIDPYDWEQIVDDASGILIGGNSGSGKTSIGAGHLVGRLTANNPAEVIVLDIHASRNPIWREMGFPRVVDDASQIVEVMQWFIGEIETRKRSDRHHIVVILDEINDLLSELEHMDGKRNGERVKTVTYAIRKLSNARKFDITLLGFMQSHNVDAIGIDAKFRNNFLVILTGSSARAEVLNKFTHDTLEAQYIKAAPYPCCVSGSNPLQIAEHPTHGHHEKYRKKGNAPANLIKPNLITEGLLIPSFDYKDEPQTQPSDSSKSHTDHKPNPSQFDLSKPEESPPTPEPEQPNIYQLIIELAISNGGSCTAREVQRQTWGRNLKADAVRYAFEVLEREGKGRIETKKVPGGVSVTFAVTPPK